NRLGKGNPHARRMAALRQAFLSAATEERMKEMGEKLLAAALAGDWQAAKLVLLYALGRPVDVVDPDRLDLEEWRQCQEWPDSLNDPALGFAGQRRIDYAEAVWRIQRLSELGQGILVPLSPEAELPEGEDRTPAERRE